MGYTTELTFKEEITLAWWWLFNTEKYDLYLNGCRLGMAKRFAIKRAKKYGEN